jgi:putative intracellular protease/amidase
MKKRLLIAASALAAVLLLGVALLPQLLTLAGLHPHFDRVEYQLDGKKALIVTTSHITLGASLEDTEGAETGVYPSEMTIPYYEFLDAGMQVDLASIQGGEIPLEPVGTRWPLVSDQDERFFADPDAMSKLENSMIIDEVDFLDYDIIFIAGGWGAAYDIATSELLGDKITEANAEDILLGSVCHGALGFRLAEEVDGRPLVEGKRVSGVTDKQVEELNIQITPYHPEEELRRQGAIFESETAFRDFFATYVAVDGNLVTGQNQNSSGETAQTLLALLAGRG